MLDCFVIFIIIVFDLIVLWCVWYVWLLGKYGGSSCGELCYIDVVIGMLLFEVCG